MHLLPENKMSTFRRYEDAASYKTLTVQSRLGQFSLVGHKTFRPSSSRSSMYGDWSCFIIISAATTVFLSVRRRRPGKTSYYKVSSSAVSKSCPFECTTPGDGKITCVHIFYINLHKRSEHIAPGEVSAKVNSQQRTVENDGAKPEESDKLLWLLVNFTPRR